jgi:LmbE family N-acetylglucosaminyl deacetylase
MSVLCVAAHPDDEVLGCGGTIARLAEEGKEVFIAILGEGITSRFKERDGTYEREVERLHDVSKQVAKRLGATDIFLKRLPDNRFDTIPMLELAKIIEEFVTLLKPEVIYTHHSADLNVDHSVLNRAVLTATRPVPGCPVKQIYSFEIPSSTEWSFYQGSNAFRPNVFFDITKTLDTKLQAMRLYESEIRLFPHPRSPEALRALARHRGSVVGLEAAEAFELVRIIES